MIKATTHPEAKRRWREHAVVAARKIMLPPLRPKFAEWVEANIRLPSSRASEPGPKRVSRTPYLREIGEALLDPTIYEVVIKKASRLGVTDYVINDFLAYIIAVDPGAVLVLWPTKEDAQDWSKEVLPEMFESTVALRGKVSDVGEKDSDNTILHKRFIGGTLAAIGSNSPRALRRKSARYVLIDEYDACRGNGKEGDVGARAVKRANTFDNRKIVKTGSPTRKGSSVIARDYDFSDQREFFVPCPHCKARQIVEWKNIQWDKEGAGPTKKHLPETACLICVHCGAEINERHKRKMVEQGTWIAQRPGRPIAGFKLNALVSLFPGATWAEFAREWLAAQGNPELMEVFVNTVLGEEYEDRSEAPDAEILETRREVYPAEVPAGVAVLTAAVDIADDRLELLIKGWGVGQESWDIEHHRIYGDPDAADRAVWRSLDRLLFRRFQHESGAQLTVRATAVDTGDGDHIDACYAYCKTRRRLNVYPVKGENLKKGQPNVIRPSKSKLAAKRLFLIADDRLKRIVLRRVRIQQPGPGYLHFPQAGTTGLDTEYLEQFRNEVEKPQPRRDGTVAYVFQRRGPNEAIDLQKYNLAMLHVLGDAVLNYLPQLLARVTADGVRRGGLRASAPKKLTPAPDDPIVPRGKRRSRVRYAGMQA